jgi:hypothetical protein
MITSKKSIRNILTTYTLTCRAGDNTFTKTANVNVLPSWVEK